MIKFNQHNVTNGTDKARVHYSETTLTNGKKCVTLYAKDYSRTLGAIFAGQYINDTDTQTDYFDQGRVRIFEGDALYPAALERARTNEAALLTRQAIKDAKRRAKRTTLAA